MAEKRKNVRRILIHICAAVLLLFVMGLAVICIPRLLPDYKNEMETYTSDFMASSETYPVLFPWNLYTDELQTDDSVYTGMDVVESDAEGAGLYMGDFANHYLQVYFTYFDELRELLRLYQPLGRLDTPTEENRLEFQSESGICYGRELRYRSEGDNCILTIAFSVEQSMYFHISRAECPEVTLDEMEEAEKEIATWIEQTDFYKYDTDYIEYRELQENPIQIAVKTLVTFNGFLDADRRLEKYEFLDLLQQKQYTCMYYEDEILIQFGNNERYIAFFYSPADRLITGYSLNYY